MVGTSNQWVPEMAIDFPMFSGPSFCSSAWSAASGAQEKWEDVAWEGHKKHLTING